MEASATTLCTKCTGMDESKASRRGGHGVALEDAAETAVVNRSDRSD
jgi:hypothetical protein